jgi:pimeloyl-ACP methyl ester carboxylesterase
VHSADRLRLNFQHCDLVVYPGVGHLPYEEVPEQFNKTLLGFLAKQAGDADHVPMAL